jgi:molybdopterin/thiamine biosynthesis adenylyltransferase
MKRIDHFSLRFSRQQPVCDVYIGSISRKDKKARKGRTECVLMGGIGTPADSRMITLQIDERVIVAAINGCIAG